MRARDHQGNPERCYGSRASVRVQWSVSWESGLSRPSGVGALSASSSSSIRVQTPTPPKTREHVRTCHAVTTAMSAVARISSFGIWHLYYLVHCDNFLLASRTSSFFPFATAPQEVQFLEFCLLQALHRCILKNALQPAAKLGNAISPRLHTCTSRRTTVVKQSSHAFRRVSM